MAGKGHSSHDDGGMKVVSKKKTNKPKTKVPPMSEERVLELNEMMFTYNPQKNRRDPRLKGNPFPPWAYTSESVADKGSVEYMFHPDIFKTNTCNRGASCQMRVCAFIHPSECYVPRWRGTGAIFDGVFYPPLPITYEWFKFMMLEFKTQGPCTATYQHDHARCHLFHPDANDIHVFYDKRTPIEIEPSTESWRPLPKQATQTARQYHPSTYKIEECRRIVSHQKCTKGRYCSFGHLNHEYQRLEEHLQRLMQELLRIYKVQRAKQLAEQPAESSPEKPLPPVRAVVPQPAPAPAAISPAPAPAPARSIAATPVPVTPGEAVEQHAETAVAEQLAKIQELQAQYDMLQRQLQTTTLQSNALQHTPALDTFWGPPMQEPMTSPYMAPQPAFYNPHVPARSPSMPVQYGYPQDAYARPPPPHAPPAPPPSSVKALAQWSKEDVHAWVMGQGDAIVAELAGHLYANDVDGSILLQLDDHMLRDDLGVASLGKRKKLLAAIAQAKAYQPSSKGRDAFSLF